MLSWRNWYIVGAYLFIFFALLYVFDLTLFHNIIKKAG